jgi:hypothetical protein
MQAARDALEAAYDEMVILLTSNPQQPPRSACDTSLREAWGHLLRAREYLACASISARVAIEHKKATNGKRARNYRVKSNAR